MKFIFLFVFSFSFSLSFAHNTHFQNKTTEKWHVKGEIIQGNFLMYKDGKVSIENDKHEIKEFLITDFNEDEQKNLEAKINRINRLNEEIEYSTHKKNRSFYKTFYALLITAVVLALLIIINYLTKNKLTFRIIAVGGCIILFSFTDPNEINNAFLPFDSDVNTSWDNNYFYVESRGIPSSHEMMVGISNHGWQQQVPIPQCYFGTNSWSIPLNPVFASTPIPVDSIHFTRGAIAIAVNGVPIFNPHTNTGVDAYLDGQLDNYGGHSGRGDDYHYHTAPLHLYSQTNTTLPIAYALDGFAVFGSFEPDGVSMIPLDANHGHNYNGTYHYHGTNSYPYMIANMVGQVTEDATHQIIPQAAAHPVRTENWTPLNGALITSCVPNGSSNGYNLSYSLNGVSGYATNYSWNGSTYTFDYVTPGGLNSINYNGFLQCTDMLSYLSISNGVSPLIYPNPFHSKIQLTSPNKNDNYILLNSFGQILFAGKNIEKQDFSHLSKGKYLLKINDKIFKLIKE